MKLSLRIDKCSSRLVISLGIVVIASIMAQVTEEAETVCETSSQKALDKLLKYQN